MVVSCPWLLSVATVKLKEVNFIHKRILKRILKIKKQNQSQVQTEINFHSMSIVRHRKAGDCHVISKAHAYSKPFQISKIERLAVFSR